jgi:acyl dehydratase
MSADPSPKTREIVRGPITRTQLALFAGASGDHNPIHLDDEEARKGGLPGVIAHGMLSMAFLGDLLCEMVPPDRIVSFDARFVSMAFPGDTITCRAEQIGLAEADGGRIADLKLTAANQNGQAVAEGSAKVRL